MLITMRSEGDKIVFTLRVKKSVGTMSSNLEDVTKVVSIARNSRDRGYLVELDDVSCQSSVQFCLDYYSDKDYRIVLTKPQREEFIAMLVAMGYKTANKFKNGRKTLIL